MSIVLRRQAAGLSIGALIHIAREHGYDENYVRQMIQERAGDIRQAARSMGRSIWEQFRNRITEAQHSSPNVRQRTEESTQQITTQSATMQHHHQESTGIAVEGGEEEIKKPSHIWRRFPNTDTAALKWVYSNFMNDSTSGLGAVIAEDQDPFDETSNKAATSLIGTGGGNFSALTGVHIFGANGGGLTATGHDFTNPVLFQVRMTTPYNILKTYSSPSLTQNTPGHAQPQWLEYFDSKYQFYHVLECEWELTLNFGTPFYITGTTPTAFNNNQNLGFYIFWKYTSNDTPPIQYNVSTSNIANVNNTAGPNVNASGTQISGINPLTLTDGGLVTCNPDDYFRMGGWNKKHIKLNSTHPTQTHIQGHYKFGQCKMDVKTQEATTVSGNALQTEGWLQTGSTYTFPEDLSIIIVQDNAMCEASGVYTPCGFRWETEQIVQFKDLRSAFKFPTPQNALINSTTTLNTDAAFFSRGAAYT